MYRKALFLGGAFLAATALGACTTADEQAALNTLSSICQNIPQAATIAVSITSDIPGLGWVSTPITAAAAVAAGVCSATETFATDLVNQINSLGGTATVSVVQTGGSPASLEAMASQFRGRLSGVRLRATSEGTVIFSFKVLPQKSIL